MWRRPVRSSLFRIASLVAPILFAGGPAFANLLANGSFDADVGISSSSCDGYRYCKGYDPSVNDVPGWYTIGKGGVDSSVLLLSNDYRETDAGDGKPLRFTAANGTQSLDLTGAGNQGENGVKQSVALQSGVSYLLSFYVGNQYNSAPGYPLASSIGLYINGVLVTNYTNGKSQKVDDVTWEQFKYVFTAPDDFTTIAFLNETPVGDNFAGLDGVNLVLMPEPAALTEMTVGALAIGLIWHLRQRRREAPETASAA